MQLIIPDNIPTPPLTPLDIILEENLRPSNLLPGQVMTVVVDNTLTVEVTKDGPEWVLQITVPGLGTFERRMELLQRADQLLDHCHRYGFCTITVTGP